MATVPRIAAVSCFSTMPLIYGVRHAGNLRAELLLSDPEEVIREFSEHRADIALVPFWAVPSLAGAKIDEKAMAHTEAIILSMTPKELSLIHI